MAEATVAKNEAFRSAMKLKNPAGADEAEEDSQNGGGTAQNHEVVPLRPEEGSDDAKSDDDVGSPARHSTHKLVQEYGGRNPLDCDFMYREIISVETACRE